MSTYQLNKAIYHYLSPRADGQRLPLEREALMQRFELSAEELDAVLCADIRQLSLLGVHPVLLNSFARARQVPREQYRSALASLLQPGPGQGG